MRRIIAVPTVRQIIAIIICMLWCCAKAHACGDNEGDEDLPMLVILGIYFATFAIVASCVIRRDAKKLLQMQRDMAAKGECIKELPTAGSRRAGQLLRSALIALPLQFIIWPCIGVFANLMRMCNSIQ